MKHVRIVAVAVAIAMVVAALLWAWFRSAPPLEVSLSVPERARSTPVYVALEKGYFAEEGIKPVLSVPEVSEAGVSAMLAGSIDFAFSPGVPVIEAVRAGKPLSILAAVSYADVHMGIVTAPKAGINDIYGLKGKRVAVVAGTTSVLYLTSALKSYGMSFEDVTLIPATPRQSLALLQSGQADAASVWRPWLDQFARELGPQAKILRDESSFFDYFFLVGPARSGPPAEKELRLLRALRKANAFIHDYPNEANAIMVRHAKERTADWNGTYFDLQLDESVLLNLQSNDRLMSGDARAPDFAAILRRAPLAAVVEEAAAGKTAPPRRP